MATRRALLLIADIGGYTEYMQFHRSILGHAEAATSRMLDKVVDAARGFDLIEIEGDAAFLSREADGLDGPATLAAITEAAVAMHRAFHEQRRLVELNMCPCGSCTQTSDAEAEVRRARRRGRDPDDQAPAEARRHGRDLRPPPAQEPGRRCRSTSSSPRSSTATAGTAPSEPAMQEIAQDLEGIGPVRTYFMDVEDIAAPLGSAAGSLVAPAHRRHGRHGRPGPAVHPPPAPRRRAGRLISPRTGERSSRVGSVGGRSASRA